MKKSMVVVAVMAMVVSGTAFAGDPQSAGSKPNNGITYFDPGQAPACDAAPAKASQENDPAPYNGVTSFEQRESGAKGSCANKAEKEIKSSKSYNGVTAF